jgi:phage-related baseplate assembly protein
MARYLVVANRTVVSDDLYDLLRSRTERGPAEIHVLVPAASDPSTWRLHVQDEDVTEARARLETALERFRALGATVTGEVGDASPLQAVGDVLRTGATFDEVIVSTLPPRASRWLRMDLPTRIERSFGLAVTHVVDQTANA